MKYLSTSDGSPRLHARHPAENNDACIRLLFSATTVSATLSRCFSQVPCSRDDIGPDLPDQRKHLVIHRAAIGRAHNVGVQRRNAGTGGKLGNAEVSRLLSLAQTGQQGTRGQIAPDQNQRAPIAFDAAVGKFDISWLRSSRHSWNRHLKLSVGTLAMARISGGSRKSKPRPQTTTIPADRDHRHAGTEAEHLCAGSGRAEAERYFDKPVGRPRQHHAREPMINSRSEQRQRTEFDDARKTPVAASARDRAGN